MKSNEFKLRIGLVLMMGLLVNELMASGMDGGQITYRLIDSNTGKYRFRLEKYRSCYAVQFGAEQITVVKQGYSGAINTSLISIEEITPISYYPDVATRATTNCPGAAPIGSNGINGYQKAIYETDYTVGKNIGWALIGFSTCCRSNLINTGGASNAIYIQAAINTNYNNSSVEYNTSPMSLWTAGRDNNYAFGAYDRYDPNFININGNYIRRDSLTYQLITPFQSMSSNVSDAFNLSNQPVTLNSPLTAQNFIYTNGGVSLNQTTGLINCNPSQSQTGILGFVTREYRAIPNANGIGYSRTLVGYTMRDVEWSVKSANYSKDIFYNGIIKDSSNIESLVNNYTAKTCKLLDNKIVFKIVGSPYDTIKLKENSFIDTSVLSNYSISYTKVTVGNVDTIYATLRFNKKKNITHYNFLYKAFYTNSIGYQIERYIPIRVLFDGSYYTLSQDSASYCIGSSPLRLSNPQNTKVSWSPKTNIVAAQSPDSSWIDINPPTSRWYYVNNLALTQGCKINDSIFVKVDSCRTISGYLFSDDNNNCVKDPTEAIIANKELQVKGVSNAYNQTITTDSNGYYSFNPFFNSSYTIEGNHLLFNCSSQKTKFTASIANTSISINIPVKDTATLLSYSASIKDTSICHYDSLETNYNIFKSYGSLKAVLYISNGDSNTIVFPMSAGSYYGVLKTLIKTSASKTAILKFYAKNNRLVLAINLNSFSFSSCLKAKIFYDIDSNCSFNNGSDIEYINDKAYLKNLTSSKIDTVWTDSRGNLKLKLDLSSGYELNLAKYLICPSNVKFIQIPSVSNMDTTISIIAPIDPIYDFSTPSRILLDTSDCIFDNQRFVYSISKPAGQLKSILSIGNMELIDDLSYSSGYKEIDRQFSMNNVGSYTVILRLVNKYNDTIYTDSIAKMNVTSCIKGTLYKDKDSNCVYNPLIDRNLQNVSVRIRETTNNQWNYLFTDINGKFKFHMNPSKNYNISFSDTIQCPTLSNEVLVNSVGMMDTTRSLEIGLKPISKIFRMHANLLGRASNTSTLRIRLDLFIVPGVPKPEREFLITYTSFKIKFDTVLYAKQYYQSGNSITIIDTGDYGTYVRFSFDSVVASDSFLYNVTLVRVGDEYGTTRRINVRAETSYDPNLKMVDIASMRANGDFTNNQDQIEYTVHFQNTGNAEARDVYILDTLDSKLDINTLRINGWSHNMVTSMDENKGLKFEFKNILLPDSNSNEPASHGFLTYSISPQKNLAPQTVLKNSASIYFDFNPPILTNTTLNKYILKSSDTASGGGGTGGSGGSGGSGGGSGTGGGGGKDSTLVIAGATHAQIRIYPNPINTTILIDKGTSNSPYHITIHSLDGKQVYFGLNPGTIDVSRLDRGVYILEYASENECSKRKIQLE